MSGSGKLVAEYPVTREWIMANDGDPDASLMLISVSGTCMEPTLRDGALIAIQACVTPADLAAGGVYVFAHLGRIFVKRLRLDATRLLVIEDARPAEVKIVPRAEFERSYSFLHRVFWTGSPDEVGKTIADLLPQRRELRIAG